MSFLLETGFLYETTCKYYIFAAYICTGPGKPIEMKKKVTETNGECSRELLAVKDAMGVLSGKWKIQIISSLMNNGGALRFMDLLRLVDGIAAKMLSKELHDLEINLLVKRTVLHTKPVTVEYELTPHGKTLERTIKEIHLWGKSHRKKIIGK